MLVVLVEHIQNKLLNCFIASVRLFLYRINDDDDDDDGVGGDGGGDDDESHVGDEHMMNT